jgi:cell pole-organizing protein PopZ
MSTPAKPEPEQPNGDPSMEDILASIRRILSEDEQAPTVESERPDPGSDDVLVLDSSMMVAEPTPSPPGSAPPAVTASGQPEPGTAVALAEPAADTVLVSPESARAAAASVAGLVATLASERNTQTHRGGPTVEDLVRAELRPLLKAWLDTHLPPLVERLVRAEIERVVSRTSS